jgi:hypothetical protein
VPVKLILPFLLTCSLHAANFFQVGETVLSLDNYAVHRIALEMPETVLEYEHGSVCDNGRLLFELRSADGTDRWIFLFPKSLAGQGTRGLIIHRHGGLNEVLEDNGAFFVHELQNDWLEGKARLTSATIDFDGGKVRFNSGIE